LCIAIVKTDILEVVQHLRLKIHNILEDGYTSALWRYREMGEPAVGDLL
jgi:hypothetical protein